ncbi:hypothetical protein EJB05_27823, partial [Eragrostis curvula]
MDVGELDPPEAAERRRARGGPRTGAAIFLLALPPLLLASSLLLGDRAADLLFADLNPVPCSADRLLGGLLSPEFGDETTTCLSRYAVSKRWVTPSPFPVSPYLVRKLRRYEARHRRCGPGTTKNNSSGGECRYFLVRSCQILFVEIPEISCLAVTFEFCFSENIFSGRYMAWLPPAEGLGNRMRSLVSAFLYALLTDRVLLVRETPEMQGLFCEPFPGTSWLLPPDVPYADDDGLHLRRGNNTSSSYIDMERSKYRLQDHRVLDRLRSESYFAVALFLVPMYRAELDRMFPSGNKGAVFHHLGRYHLRPGNRAWAIVERFYDDHLAGADELLGIQHGLLPVSKKKKAVLVASLKREYYDKLRAVYHDDDTAVHQASHDGEQRSGDRAHNERALAEIFLLSYCDRVVTTAMSTFGYAEHALAGLRPWMLRALDWTNKQDDDDDGAACVRAASVEPCLHSAPSLECCRAFPEQVRDPVARFPPFLRHCEDVSFGLKLFHD